MNDNKSHYSLLKSANIGYTYAQIKTSNIPYTKIMNGIFSIIMNGRFSHLHIMILVTCKHMTTHSKRHQYDVNMTSMMFHTHLYKTRINYVHSILITSTIKTIIILLHKNNLQNHFYQQQSLLQQQQPHPHCEESNEMKMKKLI